MGASYEAFQGGVEAERDAYEPGDGGRGDDRGDRDLRRPVKQHANQLGAGPPEADSDRASQQAPYDFY